MLFRSRVEGFDRRLERRLGKPGLDEIDGREAVRSEQRPELAEFALAPRGDEHARGAATVRRDRKSTRLNSSHRCISYAVFCLKKKNYTTNPVESLNSSIRKYTRSKTVLPDDQAALKSVFLAICNIQRKCTMPLRN